LSPRKFAPVVLFVLLLSALLMMQFTHKLTLKWPQPNLTQQEEPVQPAGGQPSEERLVELNVTVSLPPESFELLSEHTAAFADKYPHIQVRLHNEEMHEGLYADWLNRQALGHAPDVMLLDNGWVAPFAVKGHLMPADNALAGDAQSDQLASVLDPLRWNGYLWAVPKDLNPYALFWNGPMLEEAGLDGPPESWDEWMEAAARLAETDAEADAEAGAGPQRLLLNLSPGNLSQLQLFVGKFEPGDDGAPWLPWASSEKQSELLAALHGMSDRIAQLPAEDVGKLSGLIESGKLLAAILPWDSYEKLGQAAAGRLLRDDAAAGVPWLQGRSFAVSSRSEAEAEASLWIREMTEAAVQQADYVLSGRLPVRASLYGGPQRRDGGSPPPGWKELLEVKLPDNRLGPIRPGAAADWLLWEKLWREYSEGGLRLDLLAEALAAQGGSG